MNKKFSDGWGEGWSGKRRPRPPRIFAAVLLVIGSVLGLGGGRLLTLGGSLYYLIAGVALIATAVGLWRGRRWGAYLYGALTLGTVIWAIAEAGFDGWALAPRVLPFLVLGLFLLRPRTRHALLGREPRPLRNLWTTWAVLASLAAVGIGVALHEPYPTQPFPGVEHPATLATSDWQHWGGSAAGRRFAAADQIDTGNVSKLQVAWTYRTGVSGAFKATPLQIRDTLYVCLAGNIIAALDSATGIERWRFDPELKDSKVGFTTTCRGVTYYKAPDTALECAERILTATTDARLIAVDAATGKRCPGFGQNGEVSLLNGMGEVKPGFYYVTSPPTLASGVAVLGGWVADNVEVQEPSGVIRGFDPISGRMLWAWDIGRTEPVVSLAPDETFTRGTPNAWSVFSADDELGLVYIPTGNATPDYYGGHRSPESERFASSVVALAARTGKLRWSFQTTHHDIWDYDVPSQPVLVDFTPAGKTEQVRALVAPTKRGELFLLDRVTGQPLADVEERPVPQTDVPHEWTAKTQPFSVGMPSFNREPLTEAKMWGITPIDQMLCRIQFRRLRYEGPLTPPSVRGSLQFPGFAGGMNWGSVAIDEVNNVMVVNALQIANHVRLFPRSSVRDDTVLGFGGGRQLGTPYAAFTTPFLSTLFAPCQQPPYGEIAAVDLRTRSVLWRRPLGTANELGPLGLKFKLPLPMGVPYSGGTVVTQGGLIFMGGTLDRRFRALELSTGKILWSDVLPNNAQATPMSYVSPGTGKQYVVIAVPAVNTPEDSHVAEPEAQRGAGTTAPPASGGGWLIAYALPEVDTP
ncbi:membrane-bound PQQ-dependent dehydrogenase, glucose/quinate/shikimate family [Steroidobacter sp.]|uniref:membrane-bound PQQ-dependent dehydrogenase, glucose/quinate/shikimate family n=1 Tax=Steroidobacter sp. TaxID=1978227 RepID=UPI001A3F84B3|nr:membrane-bound PQQ-dependent dehydrogenase, glucose/quinate/shikimate family [Steroidobacter sp.]MBL8268664.1 membrane-bound PQQ-dependent dehydrogenase, glucose/quinate/shikimate family [Steroidobacter sp.]